MPMLILGLVVFFGVHLVRVLAPGWRAAQVAASERRWKGLYAVASLVGIVLIVWGWTLYRSQAVQLYTPPDWGRYATMLLVWLGLIGVAAAYQPAGRIKATLQNPFLVGVILWSIGHLLANGDLAGVLVFGSFLVYAVVDLASISTRGQPRAVFTTYRGDVVAIVAGTVIYLILVFWPHAVLFGVSPIA